MKWKNIYRGFAMGISDVVPGVSGGTIAVILKFYDELIMAINGFFSRKWKEHLRFLVPLAIGMGLAIFSFSRVMDWLLTFYERPTYYFFLGLIVGILPNLFKESKARITFQWYHYVFLLFGIGAMVVLPLNPEEGSIIVERTFSVYLLLFFSGFIASAAMILPGISGSLVLYVIGVYRTVIHAVSTFDLKVIIIVGIGIALGIIVMSKVIHYFLSNYRLATFAFIIGLVTGSIYVIFPGWSSTVSELIITTVTFILGLTVAVVLGKIEYT